MVEKERERKRQQRLEKEDERQRINRDMARAYEEGNDFDVYAQIGLRMLIDKSDSGDDDDYDDRTDLADGFSGYAVEVKTQPRSTNQQTSTQKIAITGYASTRAHASRHPLSQTSYPQRVAQTGCVRVVSQPNPVPTILQSPEAAIGSASRTPVASNQVTDTFNQQRTTNKQTHVMRDQSPAFHHTTKSRRRNRGRRRPRPHCY